jgi:hypothetical protein
MGPDDDTVGYEQARRLRGTMSAAGIDRQELWLHYFSIGGDLSEFEVDAYLHHSLGLPALQRDLLAHAANELLAERLPPSAPYASELRGEDESFAPGTESEGHSSIRDSDVIDHDDPEEPED